MNRILWAIALAAAAMVPASAAVPAAPVTTTEAAAAPAATAPSTTAPAAATPAAPTIEYAAPAPGIGIPDGRKGTQEQFTDVGRQAQAFHDNWLLPLCVAISLFVLILLGYTMIRYRRAANPTPSRTSHNTMIEVIWTLVPVLILVAIAVPSISLLSRQYSPPPADLTVKVIGNQWYWTYQYPDNGGFEIVSNMLKEADDPTLGSGRARTDADGPPLLAVDERVVIPVGKVVKFIVTSNDVIHAFAVPAFWTKMDANPGRLNETWVKVDREGVYFGQCSELCGARHGYMPIAVEVVSEAKFAQWIAAKGGTMPGATPAPAADSTGSSPVTTPAVPAEAQPLPNAGPAPDGEPVVAQPATNQAATAQN